MARRRLRPGVPRERCRDPALKALKRGRRLQRRLRRARGHGSSAQTA